MKPRVLTIGDRFKFRRPVRCHRCGVEVHPDLGNSVGAKLDRVTHRLTCSDCSRRQRRTGERQAR
jgi:hypothetical protein